MVDFNRPRNRRFDQLKIVAALWLGLLMVPFSEAATVFVDSGAVAGGNGRSWDEAKQTIAEGLAVAVAGEEVWVAGGTYRESIVLRDAIELYGGFVGNESQLSARNSSINQTIIDASEANGGSPANHAVLMDSLTHSRIDGFRITGGEATDFGGGILCLNLNPTNTIAHCVIQGNRVLLAGVGAGISCIDSSPFISDCIISGNDASVHDLAPGGRGGGLYCSNASPTLTQTTILGNTANDGGGIYCVNGSSPIFSNCSILNNQAILFIPPPPAIVDGGRGGALWCDASSPILTDSTIGGNQAASSGGGFHVTQNSVLTISRSSIVANIAFLGGGCLWSPPRPLSPNA